MRQLVEMEAAGKFSLLEVCSNVLVGHLLHAGLEEVGFLYIVSVGNESVLDGDHTSSSDQDLFPPADILRARRLDGSADCEFISGRGERICG